MHFYILFFFLFINGVFAQQFTRITTGSPVTDGGDSRAVCWIDYDRDGDLDLYITNSLRNGENDFFYKNNGDGTFTKIDTLAINRDGGASDGASWADINNDGYPDVAMVTWYGQKNFLFRNNGNGSFTHLSQSPVSNDYTYSETCSWGDYDNDGLPDLYITNSAGNLQNILYHNLGNDNFQRVSAPFLLDAFHSRNVDWIDINKDGKLDLFVTNEEGENESVYLQDSTGSFVSASIPGLTDLGGSTAGSSWADVDNDGDFDVLLVNYNNERNILLLNNGNGTFSPVNSSPFISDVANSFGSCFGDIDNDGDQDLFISNAFTGTNTTANYLYINNGDGTFTKDTGIIAKDRGWTYGAAFGDYNKDGWLDLFIAKCYQKTENNSLYKNNGGTNNWIVLDLEGRNSNRSALGAIVTVKTTVNGRTIRQMRRVAGQEGYCGQNLQVHFGLGTASIIDSLIITWPRGNTTIRTNVSSGVFYHILEDSLQTTGLRTEPINRPDVECSQPFPNPANEFTCLRFSLPDYGQVRYSVFSSDGENVLSSQPMGMGKGDQSLIIPCTTLSAGVYFCTLFAGDKLITKKFVVAR